MHLRAAELDGAIDLRGAQLDGDLVLDGSTVVQIGGRRVRRCLYRDAWRFTLQRLTDPGLRKVQVLELTGDLSLIGPAWTTRKASPWPPTG